MSTPNRINHMIPIKAPMSRVWRAIMNADEFHEWFGVKLDRTFEEGQSIRGRYACDVNDFDIADYQKSLGLVPRAVKIPTSFAQFCNTERVEPQRYLSFRWIPFSIDASVDSHNEPTTLVEFLLETASQWTVLTIRESGFDQVPQHRRHHAFLMNDGCWSAQLESLRRHVESALEVNAAIA